MEYLATNPAVAFHLNEILMRRIESNSTRITPACQPKSNRTKLQMAPHRAQCNISDDEDDEEEDEDDAEDEVLLAPIRTETYVGDEEDLEFVAPDDEEESDNSEIDSNVHIVNILPPGSRRISRKPIFYMMVPTPDDDRLLVDVGESATEEEEEDDDISDNLDGESLAESSGDDDYHIAGAQSRRVWLLRSILPISVANIAAAVDCPDSREECLDELDKDYSPPAGYDADDVASDEGDISSSCDDENDDEDED